VALEPRGHRKAGLLGRKQKRRGSFRLVAAEGNGEDGDKSTACGTGAWRLLACVRMLTEPQVEGGSARRCVPYLDVYLTPAHT
jgi:hypothetical protein